jgi:hypothetical protein
LPKVFRHVVADVEVDPHTHQGLELVFEAGDVEQENLADHCWRDDGEQIEVTSFVIIASTDRAEEFGLSEAIGLDKSPNLPSLPSYSVSGPHNFLLEPQALIDAPGESAFWCPSFRSSSGSLDSV